MRNEIIRLLQDSQKYPPSVEWAKRRDALLKQLLNQPAAQIDSKDAEHTARLTDDEIYGIGFRVFGQRPNNQETEFARAIEDAALAQQAGKEEK